MLRPHEQQRKFEAELLLEHERRVHIRRIGRVVIAQKETQISFERAKHSHRSKRKRATKAASHVWEEMQVVTRKDEAPAGPQDVEQRAAHGDEIELADPRTHRQLAELINQQSSSGDETSDCGS